MLSSVWPLYLSRGPATTSLKGFGPQGNSRPGEGLGWGWKENMKQQHVHAAFTVSESSTERKTSHLLQRYRGSYLRNPTGVYPHSRGMKSNSAVRHHHSSASSHLLLTGWLHVSPSHSTFGLTKPALVLCLMRHLFLINSIYCNHSTQARWYVLRNAVRLFTLY